MAFSAARAPRPLNSIQVHSPQHQASTALGSTPTDTNTRSTSNTQQGTDCMPSHTQRRSQLVCASVSQFVLASPVSTSDSNHSQSPQRELYGWIPATFGDVRQQAGSASCPTSNRVVRQSAASLNEGHLNAPPITIEKSGTRPARTSEQSHEWASIAWTDQPWACSMSGRGLVRILSNATCVEIDASLPR